MFTTLLGKTAVCVGACACTRMRACMGNYGSWTNLPQLSLFCSAVTLPLSPNNMHGVGVILWVWGHTASKNRLKSSHFFFSFKAVSSVPVDNRSHNEEMVSWTGSLESRLLSRLDFLTPCHTKPNQTKKQKQMTATGNLQHGLTKLGVHPWGIGGRECPSCPGLSLPSWMSLAPLRIAVITIFLLTCKKWVFLFSV